MNSRRTRRMCAASLSPRPRKRSPAPYRRHSAARRPPRHRSGHAPARSRPPHVRLQRRQMHQRSVRRQQRPAAQRLRRRPRAAPGSPWARPRMARHIRAAGGQQPAAAAQGARQILGQHPHVGALGAQHPQLEPISRAARAAAGCRSPASAPRVRPSVPAAPGDTAARPARLSAEYIGGVCCCAPWKRASTASTCVASTAGTGQRSTIAPSRIAGLGALPELDAEQIAFAQREHLPGKLGGLPRQIGSMPLASGSRLPVCPALMPPASRRTRCSAALEDSPSGLSSSSTPTRRRRSSVLVGRQIRLGVISRVAASSRAARAVGLHRSLDQLRQVRVRLRSRYRDETPAAARVAASVRAPSPRADSRRRCAGRPASCSAGCSPGKRQHMDTRVAQVIGHVHRGHRDVADPRILDAASQQRRQRALHLRRDTRCPGGGFGHAARAARAVTGSCATPRRARSTRSGRWRARPGSSSRRYRTRYQPAPR